MNVSQNEVTDQEMQRMFPSIQRGGHWSPTDCRPTHKLAILIPFRGRHAHLHVLLPNLIPMLMRQRLDFTIFVIEQVTRASRLIYDWLLGGVIGFTKGQYEMVNGYSNLYFGWGGEDDDMYDR
ncbi:beta-N-acetyl-D-glucosaminide beta-1,4-N-acetylglucosaminyl-transferase-like [Aplysia californica]|uniref:Beta-N-acetyl-D-glucosaminide beta-1,4-N-acetylglucosaminyl-transferase-like n=1 Tax=Aplysia californica TaxID=6500 RepID=A0ABM0ZYA5_APLCA|nr:beta-N-acetyl-D-glucosaminide beta-1,4-N-acetylglucosaminyl-transferase-like [Aplysia californica]